jgi:hypothetical protein
MSSIRARRCAAAAAIMVALSGCGGGAERISAPSGVVEAGDLPTGDLPTGDDESRPPAPLDSSSPTTSSARPEIRWRRSRSFGTPSNGRLVNGVRLPSEGAVFFTWDPARREAPNRAYRRYGTARLMRVVLSVLRSFARAHPDAPRVGIGDLSRRRGGDFGPQFGGLGHSSHQNGLDVDIYYPRVDGLEVEARHPRLIDRELSQDLVDRFVRAGAQFVFVGPRTRLTGPPDVVQVLPHHDNHLHVRLPPR